LKNLKQLSFYAGLNNFGNNGATTTKKFLDNLP